LTQLLSNCSLGNITKSLAGGPGDREDGRPWRPGRDVLLAGLRRGDLVRFFCLGGLLEVGGDARVGGTIASLGA